MKRRQQQSHEAGAALVPISSVMRTNLVVNRVSIETRHPSIHKAVIL
jgi:hypothetical protein